VARGCGNGSAAATHVTVSGDVPIAYDARSTRSALNPTNGAPTAPAAT
jgi:hypothetical protein